MDLYTGAMINVMPQVLAKISQKFQSFPSNFQSRITRNFRGDVKKKISIPRDAHFRVKDPWARNVAEAT
jgi:hypothetical protein